MTAPHDAGDVGVAFIGPMTGHLPAQVVTQCETLARLFADAGYRVVAASRQGNRYLWGPSFTDEEVEQALEGFSWKAKVRSRHVEDIERVVAQTPLQGAGSWRGRKDPWSSGPAPSAIAPSSPEPTTCSRFAPSAR